MPEKSEPAGYGGILRLYAWSMPYLAAWAVLIDGFGKKVFS